MKKLITICLAATMILAISSAAIGSVPYTGWNPSDPAKWVQLPDLNPTGLDVLATTPKVLADDFLCTSTGPITDIHIWGSWLQDRLPLNSEGQSDASLVTFRLSIHSDIPKGLTGGYSRPNDVLWEKVFNPGDFTARLYAGDLQEGFYNPNTNEIIGSDTQVWQYNFFIDPALAFLQQGTLNDPIVYWLDVEASPVFIPGTQEQPLFGWKTSTEHWNDDAVWGDSITPPTIDWQELVYPKGHPFEGQSMDLAFVITPEPATICLLAIGSLAFIGKKEKINKEK